MKPYINNLFPYFAIILLCFILAFLKYQNSRYSQSIQNLETQIKIQKNISKLERTLEGQTLSYSSLGTLYGDMICIDSLLHGESSLFVAISDLGCESCYLPFLEKLSSLKKRQRAYRFSVLCFFEDKRSWRTYINNINLDLDFYFIQRKEDGFEEHIENAFVFTMSKDKKINNVLLLDGMNKDYQLDYLKLLVNKLK